LHSKDLIISKIKIKIEGGFLSANLVETKDKEVVKSKKTLIVISHGFSDIKETLQYLYFPLAYQGFSILTYDARGIGESKLMGHRGDFIKRIEDFKMIIEWIKKEEAFKNYKIYTLGMSIGALTALCAGFPNKDIEKIIAISSMSHYKQSISTSHLIVKFIYYLKGVDISPTDEKNQQLSPYLVLEKFKSTLSPEEWEEFSKRVLLIHSRNDKVIPFLNFEENRSLLELSEDNVLILRKGGHMQKKNELALVGAVLKFFNL
ncbi:MAG: alpha/beta hydrolase, partial [Candidatus Hodarchaeota archaeon]